MFDDRFPKVFLSVADFRIDYEPNGWFSFIDSSVLAAFLRLRNPKKVVEVGSGYSTSVMRQAYSGELICIDPAPRSDIDRFASLHIKDRVENVPVDLFESADVVFIDSSHVWRLGDLPFLYGKVFPVLRPGTLVHSHDIFLPDDYPLGWKPRGYDEQYMLEAYLKKNDEWAVLWPGYFMSTRRRKDMEPVFGGEFAAGSLWMVKTCW